MIQIFCPLCKNHAELCEGRHDFRCIACLNEFDKEDAIYEEEKRLMVGEFDFQDLSDAQAKDVMGNCLLKLIDTKGSRIEILLDKMGGGMVLKALERVCVDKDDWFETLQDRICKLEEGQV